MPRTVLACMRLRARFLPSNLSTYSVAGGLGDELMIWGVLQSFAARRPSARVTFHSRFAEVLKQVPSTIQVIPYDAGNLPKGSTGLGYVGKTQQSINEQMASRLGLVPDKYPIPLPSFPTGTPGGQYPTAGRIIVIQPVASAWTPNKQWPLAYWTKLVESLPPDVTVVELGQSSFFTTPPRHPHFVSIAGSTSVSAYLAAISHATVFVGPPSSGMHVAHAYGVPSVIVVGGYEAPVYPYPLAIQLHTNMPCSPCWLCSACPYDRACLRKINPEVVLDAVLTQLETVSSKASSHA
ncbi:glycosyltransferase family 9 protein [Verrucomicrobium sp. BvORR034]|uniref:glycosyltransferase family 9 protein n=1 Tax=Verrucomicrobium sp. BvORR034 TaxID=1396418 RepID=UPI000679324F|nr:glycosyltransferase family 9 protein [Verrucomicrobium sp. BvORR034]